MLQRLKFLFDKSALLLIVPAMIALFLLSPSMARTMIEWSLFAFVLAGAAIIISRLAFPQIYLTDFVNQSLNGNRAAAVVTSAIILFVAALIFTLAFWAKA